MHAQRGRPGAGHLRACVAAPSGAATLREPRAYLSTLAKGVISEHWRRQALERAYLDALAAMPEPLALSPEERLELLQTLDEIDAMLDGLAPKAREAFVLSQLEGLTYAAIAERLQISERTVKRYMQQGFERCLALVL